MSIIKSLKARRSYYAINKELPAAIETVVQTVKEVTELVPDAFNMKSARVVVVLDDKHNQLWETIDCAFGGKIPREKIDSFKAGAGTILYFYDEATVKDLQEKFPAYSDNFPIWANQANGMLQISVWSALRELGIGASVQHYNPVIDAKVKELLAIPDEYKLIAQMPFGGIVAEPEGKSAEIIDNRVKVAK